jgi:hypothetical protein
MKEHRRVVGRGPFSTSSKLLNVGNLLLTTSNASDIAHKCETIYNMPWKQHEARQQGNTLWQVLEDGGAGSKGCSMREAMRMW